MSSEESVLLESILIRIGFLPKEDGFQFDFGNCKLKAIEGLTPQFFYGFSFLGNWRTNRSIGQIDFALPLDVESYEQGIALIAYNLRHAELEVKPKWLIEGLLLSDILPWEIEKKKYRDNPRAIIEHEWFRIIVNKFLEASKNSTEVDETTFSFDGSVLQIVCNGIKIVCSGTGKNWQSTAIVKTKSLGFLPKRISNKSVQIFIWQEKLHIGNRVFVLEQQLES
jgi:hypothetical protein